jgi:hypothetical protein
MSDKRIVHLLTLYSLGFFIRLELMDQNGFHLEIFYPWKLPFVSLTAHTGVFTTVIAYPNYSFSI